jgi:alpha-2-macroglobulin
MKLAKRLSVLSLILALIGCDNSNSKYIPPTTQNESQKTTQLLDINHSSSKNNQKAESKSVFTLTPELIEKYKNKQLTVINSSEVILDGSSTLVITFSVPINPKLNFSNLLRLVDRESGDVDGAWELSDNGLELRHRFLEPNRKLTLTIDKMLSAINDSHLQSVYQVDITTQNRQPMIGFASSGFLLPSKSIGGLPVTTLNVDQVDVNFFKIKPEKLPDLIADFGFIDLISIWRSKDLNHYADLVYSSRFNLNPKPNTQETILLNLSKISDLNQEGVYIAVMNQSGSYNQSNPASLFSISNIGVSIHAYKNGKLSVMAYALDDGKPLSDINLTLLCRKNIRDSNKHCAMISAKTDKEGYAEIALPKGSNYALLTANNGQQTSFVNLDRNALNLTEFNLSGSAFYQKQLFIFGPRDLYRPQETVYFNALLRDADGQPLPDQPIIVDVISSDGRVIENFQLKSQSESNGLYQSHFVVPSDAATGKWSLRFNLGDDNYRYSYFQVEEFLPERMSMEINTLSNKPILANEQVNFNIKGWYLYGAPASSNSLEGSLYIKKMDSISELDDYKIGSVTDKDLYKQLANIEKTLDNNGAVQINVDADNWSGVRSPIKLILQASLLDSGGRPITRYASQVIWPASELPAVKALFGESPYYNWEADRYDNRPTIDINSNAEFEVAYINTNGEKLATNDLKARFVRERRDYYWTWSDDEGWRENYNSSEFIVLENQLTIDKNSTTKVSYQPNDYGSYRIEIVDTKNNIISSLRFWVGYEWEDNTRGTNSVRPDQVKLSIDKASYTYGDTAKVYVQAPVPGAGYISLETNDGILWKRDIAVGEEGLEVEIPIKDWKRHDIYISAMIIRPSKDVTVQTVKRAIGLLYLPIDTSNRQLNVTIDVPKKTEPEKNIPIKIRMDKQTIQKEHKVTVLVSAVDSGVLNITDFTTPDPYTSFLGRKRYDVDLYDVYGKLIEASGRVVNMSFGGDAIGTGGKKSLTEVQIVAQQLKTIELNEDGEGIIELPLPNFNGELRIMAQAWDDNRFGKAEQTMIVAAPVVAELSTPRFLSGGDRAILALDVHNLTETRQTMQINITTSGLVNQDSPKTITMTLDSKQKNILQVPIIADYGFGKGIVNVDVEGIVLDDKSNYQIHRSWIIGIRPAYSGTTKDYAAAINAGDHWELPATVLTDLIDNTIDAKLVVSNKPPLNIAKYIQELFAYPYGCLEQTTSGLFPSLYANQEQLASLGIKTESDEKRREKVQLGISRILSMQRNNGSFGLWNSESDEEHWLTVYATDFLLQAKERGYHVSDVALNSAMMRIGQYIYDSSAFNNMQNYYSNSDYIEYSKFSTKAYALMVLAKHNKITSPMRNEINRMYRQFNNNQSVMFSPLPIAQLAISAKIVGFGNIYQDLMSNVFNLSYVDSNTWLGVYGSEIRDEALILSILVDNDIAVTKQADYLYSLSDLLNNTRYFSTQELNALFMAGWSLEQAKGKNKFKVEINGKVSNVISSLTKAYSFSDLNHGLTIANPQNDEPLYVKLTIAGYGKKAPKATSESNMLTITRKYYDLKGNEITPSNLKVGSMMVALIDVTAQKMIHDALIVDFLPAGFELENQNLMNSSVNLLAIPEFANLLGNEDSNDIKYQEYRDDRYIAAVNIHNYVGNGYYRKRVAYLVRAVTPGEYMLPYPYVESMYRPDQFAIGQSLDMITISNPTITDR